MNTMRTCPQCGAKLDAETPEGLCPACMMKAGLPTSAAQNVERGASSVERGNATGTDPLAPAEIAKHFPQLEILDLLGRGGMGVVYKARQKQLDRIVALKVLPSEVARDPHFAERFLREARALARLNHPNIVTVHEFGQTVGQASSLSTTPNAETGETPVPLFFLIMEFVDGVNLRQLEQSHQITPAEALSIIPKICDALQYAHEEGVVHRDIKPENILVDKKGRVKIADFGLAKLAGLAPSDARLTRSNLVMGTPHYMAPEQTERPMQVDHRADIYSLGVVFYEMLTGELPIGRFAPPSQKFHLDVRLDEVVLKSLEKEPERRYQHVSEVKPAVESVTTTPPVGVPASAGSDAVRPPSDAILQQVKGPALGLLATAIVNWILVLVPISIGLWLSLSAKPPPGPVWLVIAAAVTWLILLTSLITVGSLKMKRLESYGWAMTASIVAICGGAIGLPFGIWALVVLIRPEVKAAFSRQMKPTSPLDKKGWWPIGLAVGLHVVVLLAITVIMVVVVPRFLVVFRDMEVALPWFTRGIVGCSQFVLHGGYLLLPFLVALDVLLCWLAQKAGGRKLLVVWAVVGTCGLGALAAASMLALALPMQQILKAQGTQPQAVTTLKSFSTADPTVSKDLVMEDGGWSANCAESRTIPLFELPNPGVEDCIVIYRAQLKTEGLKGRAYLEMWCRIPGSGEFFSRGLDHVAMGSTDWASYETLAFLKKGEKPDLLRLNLVVEGAGRVGIRNVELQKIAQPKESR